MTLVTTHGLSVVRACRVAGLSRAAYYAPLPDRTEQDASVSTALTALAAERPRWGFWKCFDRLRLDGHRWNWKRVHRVYCALRLNLPRRTKRRLPTRVLLPMDAPAVLNRTWARDFMHDMLDDGRRFRTLNVRDEGTREGLAIEVGTSLPGTRVVAVLDQLLAMHGAPRALRCDNGPELLSRPLTEWCERHGVVLQHSQPGRPNQNAHIERFNRMYHREVLDAYVCASLAQVRAETTTWLVTYNTQRPDDSLGGVPPLTFCRGQPRLPSPAMRCLLDGEAYACSSSDSSRLTKSRSTARRTASVTRAVQVTPVMAARVIPIGGSRRVFWGDRLRAPRAGGWRVTAGIVVVVAMMCAFRPMRHDRVAPSPSTARLR